MKSLAPYQVFFPVGILSSLLAVGVWMTESLQVFGTPALLIHSKLMVGGFLWSFVTGFLMTAVPKMTGARPASPLEMGVGLGLLFSQVIASWILDARWFYGASMATTLFVILFAGRRILNSQKRPPVFFSHVGLALIAALAGAFFHFRNQPNLGLHLYQIAPLLLLVLGIGTRFFSFLSGLPSDFENASARSQNIFHLMGAGMFGLLILAGSGFQWSYFGLGVLGAAYLCFVWRIFRPSARSSALKWGVRMVALMIPSSFLLSGFFPDLFVAWMHFLFIGCFGMITYAVATRVILAHGAYTTDLEIRSPVLWTLVILFALAMVARLCYALVEGPHKILALKIAALLWIFAIFVWSLSFLKKIFVPGPQARPSC